MNNATTIKSKLVTVQQEEEECVSELRVMEGRHVKEGVSDVPHERVANI